MKGIVKGKVKSILSVVLAVALAFSGLSILPVNEAKATDSVSFTEITWEDFGLTSGTTYTTKERKEYTGGSNLNNTALVGDVTFAAGTQIRYAMQAADNNTGLYIGVNMDGQLNIRQVGYKDADTGEYFDYSYDASTFGLTTFAGTRFSLRVELYDLDTTAQSCSLAVYVNGTLAGDVIKVVSNDTSKYKLGPGIRLYPQDTDGVLQYITLHKEGETTDRFTKITWEDFGLTSGTTYTTKERKEYTGGSDLNNTALVGDVTFAAGTQIRYAMQAADNNTGVYIGVNMDGQLNIRQVGYKDADTGDYFDYSYDASTFGLTTFADTRFSLRVELYDLDTTAQSCSLAVYVNGTLAGNAIKVVSSNTSSYKLGPGIRLYPQDPNGATQYISLYETEIGSEEPSQPSQPSQPAQLTQIGWKDFAFQYGSYNTLGTNKKLTGYDNFNNTEFVGDIIFEEGAHIRFGGTQWNHGVHFGVVSGGLEIWSDVFTVPVTKVPASEAEKYGLESFLEQFTLKIQVYDLSETQATVCIYVNDVAVRDAFTVKPGSTGFGNVMCVVGEADVTTTIPKPEIEFTEISLSDFTGINYGVTYTSTTGATYKGTETLLDNMAFEDEFIFSAGGEFRYGVTQNTYGLVVSVTEDDQLCISQHGFKDVAGNYFKYYYEPADFGLTTLTDTQIVLRIEMYWASTTGAYVAVSVNGVQAGEDFYMISSGSTYMLGNQIAVCRGSDAAISIVYRAEVPEFTQIGWGDFGYQYGEHSTFSENRELISYDSLNNTEFVGDIILAEGANIRYGGAAWNAGVHIGVLNGALVIRSDLFTVNEITIPAEDAGKFGLNSFTESLTLKIQVYAMSGSSALMSVYVNNVAVSVGLEVTANSAGFGTKLCINDSKTGAVVEIPKPEIEFTEVSLEDFDGLSYGTQYTTKTVATYSGKEVLNNTAFEDGFIFSAGSEFRYGVSGETYGLVISVTEEDKLRIGQHGFKDVSGEYFKYDFAPSTFGLTTLTNAQIVLRIEMFWATKECAYVAVYVNGTQAGEDIYMYSSNTETFLMGNQIAVCRGNSAPITIISALDVPEVLGDLEVRLDEDVYIIPAGIVKLERKNVTNNIASWTEVSFNNLLVLDAAGDYRVQYREDGKLYQQEVIIYAPGNFSLKDYMRALKHERGVADKVYEKNELKVCDTDNNSLIDLIDVEAIKQFLLSFIG